jgi:hypothetical protein
MICYVASNTSSGAWSYTTITGDMTYRHTCDIPINIWIGSFTNYYVPVFQLSVEWILQIICILSQIYSHISLSIMIKFCICHTTLCNRARWKLDINGNKFDFEIISHVEISPSTKFCSIWYVNPCWGTSYPETINILIQKKLILKSYNKLLYENK